jgi:hypothetical protein
LLRFGIIILLCVAFLTLKAADYVVLVLGTDLSMAREGMDATSIAFSDGQSMRRCGCRVCELL